MSTKTDGAQRHRVRAPQGVVELVKTLLGDRRARLPVNIETEAPRLSLPLTPSNSSLPVAMISLP